MDTRTYLQNEQRKIKNEWHSADAWLSQSGAVYDVEKERPSVPFIIRLVNACSSSIADVDIGDSYANRASGAAAFANFNQNSNITLTSVPAGTSYIEFLSQTENQPFNVGEMVIISATASQFNETITITHRDASGKREDEVIVLTIDPYQRQTDRLTIRREYMFDGYTRLRFSNIVASATVTVHMYPTDRFAATQSVAGRNIITKYSPPQIIKVLPTAVQEEGVYEKPRQAGKERVYESPQPPKKKKTICYDIYE